jgi:hypothetical protein
MTSVKLALATIIIAISASSAQADTSTPSILASVSTDSVQTLSNSDASKTRGEYRTCIAFKTVCYYQISSKKLLASHGWSSSRQYLFSFEKFIQYSLWKRKFYVAR